MDGWMDGRMDGRTDGQTDRHLRLAEQLPTTPSQELPLQVKVQALSLSWQPIVAVSPSLLYQA